MPLISQSIPCPLCGETEFLFCFTKKERNFYRCSQCDIRLQWPLPTLQQLADYYERAFAEGMYTDFVAADEMKRMTARQRLKEIRCKVSPQGRWLDVGCANGVFVETLSGTGVSAEGIELSENAVALGRERGLTLQTGTIDDVPRSERFEGITVFDVLEHVLDPNAFLQSIHDRMADGGHMVITVPNTGGIVRRLMGKS